MKSRTAFALFRRFGLSSPISDFLITVFSIFFALFVTITASQPTYGFEFRSVADKYGESCYIVDQLAGVDYEPDPDSWPSHGYGRIDMGYQKVLDDLGLKYETVYEIKGKNYAYYAMSEDMFEYLPVSIQYGTHYRQGGPSIQCVESITKLSELNTSSHFGVYDCDDEAVYENEAIISGGVGEHSFAFGYAYVTYYFSKEEYAKFAFAIEENIERINVVEEGNFRGEKKKVIPRAKVYKFFLVHVEEKKRDAFLLSTSDRFEAVKNEYGVDEMEKGVRSFSEIYKDYSESTGSGFNNTAYFSYLAITVFFALGVIIVGQAWIGQDKLIMNAAIAIIVGATKKGILLAQMIKRLIDVVFAFVVGWFIIYYLDFQAHGNILASDFRCSVGNYWLYCLTLGALVFLSFGLKAWQLRKLDFGEAIRRDD
ncbi:MAG: hypothetical protein J6328_05025 [Bacilli bacterium]|nr:hypothetical protein [Bacilli bacterium]